MRRAGRMIYNVAVGVSLLLCFLTMGVWVRSCWVSDGLHWSRFRDDQVMFHDYDLHTERGGLQVAVMAYEYNGPLPQGAQFDHYRAKASEYPVFDNGYGRGLSDLK